MSRKYKIFLDSDVVVSALISDKVASSWIIRQPDLQLVVSNYSVKELKKVVIKLEISQTELDKLIDRRTSIVKLADDLSTIKENFQKYVLDIDDAHVVAGAVTGKADFLLSYNLKDYLIDTIKTKLGILVMTPGRFLQYLRSRN